MNAPAVVEQFIPLSEYLALEAASDGKHEYWQGRIYAMAGGSPAHAQLGFNASVAIGRRLQGKRCRGASGDQRIRIEVTGLSTYPDAVVFCPPARYDEHDPQALVNPVLIVEVLSPSTEKYDRGDKFGHYAHIPELQDYILISQDRVFVEHFQRSEGTSNEWKMHRFVLRADQIQLPNLEILVPLTEIYDGLEVPEGLSLVHGTAE